MGLGCFGVWVFGLILGDFGVILGIIGGFKFRYCGFLGFLGIFCAFAGCLGLRG